MQLLFVRLVSRGILFFFKDAAAAVAVGAGGSWKNLCLESEPALVDSVRLCSSIDCRKPLILIYDPEMKEKDGAEVSFL